MAKKYKVTFLIELDDESAHPRKWIPDAIYENLNHSTEDVTAWKFAELDDIQYDQAMAELD
jgi:hypothetical protein